MDLIKDESHIPFDWQQSPARAQVTAQKMP
jgi:hypothetical protein